MKKKNIGEYVAGETIFKEFVLKDIVGEGSFGTVYLVENRVGLPFALKVLFKSVSMEKRGLESVMRIQSNRLVRIHDYGETVDGKDCVLMEYLETSMDNVLEEGVIDEERSLKYFVEILKGLKVLEDNWILHRDIKPDNLFLLEDIIKIGDFGTAKFMTGRTSTMSEVAGTFNFMAPERFKREYGFSVDRWSSAVIFYRMLTGRYVFDGNDRTQIFGSIMMDEPNLHIVPPKYRLFFKKCFEKDFEKRHSSIIEMLDELKLIVGTENGEDEKKSGGWIRPVRPDSGKGLFEKQTVLHLRRRPITVGDAKFKKVFKLDEKRRPLEYVENEYEDNGNGTVTDHFTGLMWQQSGSKTYIAYEKIDKYIESLNDEGFAGFNDWRLPTVDELASLLEPAKQDNDLFIKPVFDRAQSWCWTTDIRSSGSVWLVYFRFGHVYWNVLKFVGYVRAVRQ